MNNKTLYIRILSNLIIVSIVFLAACSPISGVPLFLAEPDSIEKMASSGAEMVQDFSDNETAFSLNNPAVAADLNQADTVRSWEIDSTDIAAAREAAETLSQIYTTVIKDFGEDDVLRSWEIGPEDIAVAREAALALSRFNSSGVMDFDATKLVAGELNSKDISAARQVAHYLSVINRVSYEISVDDISAARHVAHYLEAAARVSGELDVSDIAAAREAAMVLSNKLAGQ
jgi:hypothetical protein